MHNELEALGGVETPAYKDFWDWVKKTFTPDYRKEIEVYLADAVNHYDLEQRIKNLTRRGLL